MILDDLLDMYPVAKEMGDDFAILAPLTFGRWRVSRADASTVMDGY